MIIVLLFSLEFPDKRMQKQFLEELQISSTHLTPFCIIEFSKLGSLMKKAENIKYFLKSMLIKFFHFETKVFVFYSWSIRCQAITKYKFWHIFKHILTQSVTVYGKLKQQSTYSCFALFCCWKKVAPIIKNLRDNSVINIRLYESMSVMEMFDYVGLEIM